MFNNVYENKKVLVTGHTGFKGSWLCTWLLKLGAEVVGISKDIPTSPAMFEVLCLEKKIKHVKADIRAFDDVHALIELEKPDFVFHLAAQAIVSTSYSHPLDTVTSNILGTANVLEALRVSNQKCTAIIITSDKAYDNVEQIWGYKENDAMGGKDVYSGSKGAAELVIKSYYHSFFKSDDSNVRLSIARAGNVIGGGDWAKDRIVVDAMIAWSKGVQVSVRSPNATRPWQHVLEPISGYLTLGERLHSNKNLSGEGFNFGPRSEQNRTVSELLQTSCLHWNIGSDEAFTVTGDIKFHEAGLLKLNCDKALTYLHWNANLDFDETIRFTNEWYFDYYGEEEMLSKSLAQIQEYEEIAGQKGLSWTE
tara:strand:+ start:11843 stop:12937 length:1095 start_codon:yes stop_codon:yes gene_type:complete